MKLILTTISLLLLAAFCGVAQNSSTPVNYKQFRTGTFEYLDGTYKGVVVKRTRKKQYESDAAVHSMAVLKIKWINDSVYTLTFVKDSRVDPKDPKFKGMVLTITITSVKDDTYTYSWVSNKYSGPGGTGSMRKLK